MNRDNIFEKLNFVFQDVFQDDFININDSTTASDVMGWDSLSNIQMVLATERAFKIRLTASQVAGLKDVGSLVTVIFNKLNTNV